MGRRVDPKNSRQRAPEGWSLPFSVGDWGTWLPSLATFRTVGLLGIGIVVALFAYDFYRFGTTADRFRVTLETRGLERVSEDRLRRVLTPVLGEDGSPSLLEVSVEGVRGRLKSALPRLRRVRVRKVLPNRLVVEVQEREPYVLVARYRSEREQRVYLPADREGVLFEPTAEEARRLPDRLPVVRGLEEGTPSADGYARKWRRVRTVISAFRERFSRGFVDWVHVLPGGYVRLEITRPRSLEVRLGLRDYGRKADRLEAMMGTSEFMEIKEYVDLSDPEDIRVF